MVIVVDMLTFCLPAWRMVLATLKLTNFNFPIDCVAKVLDGFFLLVIDDEDSHLVTAGSIVTAKVAITRSSLGVSTIQSLLTFIVSSM